MVTQVLEKTKQAGRWGVRSLGTGNLAALHMAVREGGERELREAAREATGSNRCLTRSPTMF